jgi:hypothetical protein
MLLLPDGTVQRCNDPHLILSNRGLSSSDLLCYEIVLCAGNIWESHVLPVERFFYRLVEACAGYLGHLSEKLVVI